MLIAYLGAHAGANRSLARFFDFENGAAAAAPPVALRLAVAGGGGIASNRSSRAQAGARAAL